MIQNIANENFLRATIRKIWLLESVTNYRAVALDNEIAAAEDKTDIREACIINEAIYVDIIAAGNAQIRPVTNKTRLRSWRLRWRVKTQREARAPTAESTAAELRRTDSKLEKERNGRSKTRAQTPL